MPSHVANRAPLKKLSPKHLLACYMLAAGRSNVEIAKQLGYSEGRVSQLKDEPLVIAHVENLTKQVKSDTLATLDEMIVQTAVPAFERVKELMNQDDDLGVAFRAADSLLDRAKPKIKADDYKPAIHVHLNQQIAALMQTALEEDAAREPHQGSRTEALPG